MNAMKKILAVLLTLLIAVTMTATLTGCGDDEDSGKKDSKSVSDKDKDSSKKKSKKTKASKKTRTSTSKKSNDDVDEDEEEDDIWDGEDIDWNDDAFIEEEWDAESRADENSNSSNNTVSNTTKKQPAANSSSSSTGGANSPEAAVDAVIDAINNKNANQVVNATIPSNSSLSSSDRQSLSEIYQTLIDGYNSTAAEFSGNDWFVTVTVKSKTAYTDNDYADILGVTASEAYEMGVAIMGFTTDGILIADEETSFIAYKSGSGWYACLF